MDAVIAWAAVREFDFPVVGEVGEECIEHGAVGAVFVGVGVIKVANSEEVVFVCAPFFVAGDVGFVSSRLAECLDAVRRNQL